MQSSAQKKKQTLQIEQNKIARERRIPFELTGDSYYSKENMAYLKGIAQDVKDGKTHFTEHELLEV